MRVAVTRPRPDGERVAAQLRIRGHEPVLAPVMAVTLHTVTLPAAMPDALVLTSRHAVAALSPDQHVALRDCPVFAVGAASGAAARTAGFRDIRVGGEDAAALRDLLRLTLPGTSRLLYLAGAVHKSALPHALVADGHSVAVVESYDARPVEWDAAVLAALQLPPEGWLHLSRRSAGLALAQVDLHGLTASFGTARHLCISADAAAELDRAGLAVEVAAKPTLDAVLDKL